MATLVLLIAALFAARQLMSWHARLHYPGDEAFVEGMRVVEMLHLRQGLPIYASGSGERFDAAIYGPLYYLLGSKLIDPNKLSYRPLRILSALATVGCAAVCGVLAFWVLNRYLAAAVAALVFLAFGFVSWHGTSVRCDSVALLLACSGFLIAYRFKDGRTILLACPLMLLALFYKQQFVAAPMAVLLFLLLERRRRSAAEFAAALILGALLLFVVFQFMIFPRQNLWLHLIAYNILPFTWSQFAAALTAFAMLLLVPLIMAVEYLRVHPNKLLGCYLFSSLFVAMSAIGKTGADTNYFLEFLLVVSSLVGALCSELTTKRSRAPELLCLLVATLFLGGILFAPPAPMSAEFTADREIQKYLREHFAPQTLALGFYTGDLARAGLATPISDLYQFGQLARRGAVPDSTLVAQLRQHRFRLIIMYFDLQDLNVVFRRDYFLTEALRGATLENYKLAATLNLSAVEKFQPGDRFYAWVPRN
jgi:hypothetical protein